MVYNCPEGLWEEARGYLQFFFVCSTEENQKKFLNLEGIPKRKVELLLEGAAQKTAANYVMMKRWIEILKDLEK